MHLTVVKTIFNNGEKQVLRRKCALQPPRPKRSPQDPALLSCNKAIHYGLKARLVRQSTSVPNCAPEVAYRALRPTSYIRDLRRTLTKSTRTARPARPATRGFIYLLGRTRLVTVGNLPLWCKLCEALPATSLREAEPAE